MSESVKIFYCNFETGWATRLENDRYLISNIPLVEDLNVDDVVYCELGNDGFLHVVDMIERKFPFKTTVKYEAKEQFNELFDKVKNAGFKAEGMIGPKEDQPGLCIIAHDNNLDIAKLIEEIGIKTPQLDGQTVEVL
jgi:hypothetical protein